MAARNEKSQPVPAPVEETPFIIVAGWLLVVFGFIPLLVGAKSSGLTYLAIGGGFIVAGAVLIGAGKLARRHRRESRL